LAGSVSIHERILGPAADAIRELADILEQAGFPEDAYPAPDWEQ